MGNFGICFSMHWFCMRDFLLLSLLIIEFVSSSSLIVYKLCFLLVCWWLVPLQGYNWFDFLVSTVDG